MRHHQRVTLALAALGTLTAVPALAAGDCAALTKRALPNVTVTAASVIMPDAGIAVPGTPNPVKLPFAVCSVTASARPSADSDIRIAVMIPEGAAWNGKFVQVGNGGFAGSIPYGTMLLALAKGYAVAGTDDGHASKTAYDADWALGHPEKVTDFGWRAVKTTTDTAKAIVAAYATAGQLDGGKPRRSYFFGCSDGGREALMTAQRYPGDFDGIVAGAPAYAWTRAVGAGALALNERLQPGRALPPAKLPALTAAALKACGNGKTYIADPRACHFDPGVLACKGAETDSCLTQGQLMTVRGIYGGRRDPVRGGHMPGLMPGAEAGPRGWAVWGIASEPGDTSQATSTGFGWNHFAYLVKADPKYDLRTLTDADVVAGHKMWAATLDAENPDLSAFKARGGKLIGYHGWNDPAIPPGLSLAYLANVRAKMGPTDDFYRMFLVPGMLHCRGGDAPVDVDWIAQLENWVERGAAPDALVARGADGATQVVMKEK